MPSANRRGYNQELYNTNAISNASGEYQNLEEQTPSPAGSLATTKGSFSAFLAPLTQDTFKQVVTDVEHRLRLVNQTLSMLLNSHGFETILQEMLNAITLKTAELLGADRTTIFILDEDKNQLWSIVAEGEKGKSIELRIPADRGIAGEVATSKKVVYNPYDFFNDTRSEESKKLYKKTGYRAYTQLTLPLLTENQDLVAVVQLINKLKTNHPPEAPLADKIEKPGFTEADEKLFYEFAPSIRLILESSRSFYTAAQQQRAAIALMKATESLSRSSLDLEATLQKVMDEAKQLMNADRSTLWLIDHERNDLWTKIPIGDTLKEFRVPMGEGYVGRVAQSGKPLNIGFDLYEDSGSETSKATDRKTGYRSCSLLCMPVFNADQDLIGITQLLNKKKQGEFPQYNPADWPEAPECWKASFNRTDQEFMAAFNVQAGVAIQNAKLFATVKQQEQTQRDILRSLSDGVISTDQECRIIAANESAKKLLGLDPKTRLEGKLITEAISIDDQQHDATKFAKWFKQALDGKNYKERNQYYPDQTLISKGKEKQRSVNLSINTIADASNESQVRGALVVMEDISDEKRLKSTMYRYMTQELAEKLLKLGDTKLGGDRKDVSILFSDIRSYTTLTERLTAEEVVSMLNEYFESMVDAVFQHKGTLDKYIGDAIMAVFGSPLPQQDHAWRAVQTALDMRQRLEQFNARRLDQDKEIIKIGIGIHSDSVISGNIGSSKRMEFTAIGDGVNLGARLEGATKQYGCDILISENTYQPCAEQVEVRELDKIVVKGKTKPVSIYELVGLTGTPISEQKAQIIKHYQKGREYYLQRKFTRAMGEFGIILEEFDKNDKAADLHLNRCHHFLQNPPPDDWNGAWTLTEK
ncbi:MAG: GAF domain-containing protein [Symploca sp. SIO2E9]|nr:GAF domain-containing protein [Symploca sp. SIO2E9]